MARQKPWEVDDGTWAMVEPLLPRPQDTSPGDPDDRTTLQGVLFVLYNGLRWEHLPPEVGFGSGATCQRRLAEWQRTGVWAELRPILRDRLPSAYRVDFTRSAMAFPEPW
ncbi:transposase [Saccharopolyspora sp. CA-218241]|uniref:transposase n=1 Tax=Saccharopolyspora sp. CA-218241 TaxID=3240027 RepID=UPI003D974D0A